MLYHWATKALNYTCIYKGFNINICADKGVAPLYTDHESIMLLLHQSAFKLK